MVRKGCLTPLDEGYENGNAKCSKMQANWNPGQFYMGKHRSCEDSSGKLMRIAMQSLSPASFISPWHPRLVHLYLQQQAVEPAWVFIS